MSPVFLEWVYSLGTVTRRPVCGVSALGVAALGAGAMHIQPIAVHIAHRPAKINVGGVAPVPEIGMSGVTPIGGIVVLTSFVCDGGDVEQWVNGSRDSSTGRTGVINNALQFFGVRQSPYNFLKLSVPRISLIHQVTKAVLEFSRGQVGL